MMNNEELKQAIIHDIEFLKTANVGILEKDIYYARLKKYGGTVFALLYLPILVFGLIFIKFSIYNRPPEMFPIEMYIYACALMGLLLPTIFSLSFLAKIMNWIVFEEFLLPHLRTKDVILFYGKKFFMLFWKLYFAWFALGMFIFNPEFTFAIEIGGFLFVITVINLVMYAEFTRIGAAVFFDYLSQFFDQEVPDLPLK